MDVLSPVHLLIIAAVFVLLFGAKRLPDGARSLGRSMRIFKSELRGMHEDDEAAKATDHVPAPLPVAQPVQAQPVQAQPVQAQPVQAQPVQAQPVQAQPVQAQPVQAQPVQVQPVQVQPVQVQPVEQSTNAS